MTGFVLVGSNFNCKKTESIVTTRLAPPANTTSQPTNVPAMAYTECDESEAETVLVTRLTIPGVFDDDEMTFPLRRQSLLTNQAS